MNRAINQPVQGLGDRVDIVYSDLVKFAQDTYEIFGNVYSRYQFLAGTRKILREQILPFQDIDKTERSFVNEVIRALEIPVAHSFGLGQFRTFRDSFKALGDYRAQRTPIPEDLIYKLSEICAQEER